MPLLVQESLLIIGTATVAVPSVVGAGPAIVISMVLAAAACIAPALRYLEIAAMIACCGSAYLLPMLQWVNLWYGWSDGFDA